MWRVVHFIKEETVAAVPIQWVLSANSCRWPPFTGVKLRAAMNKCSQPDESWPIHECRLLGEIYGDFTTARIKAVQAEEESDLNSDAEAGFGRRKVVKNKKYENDSYYELREHEKKKGNSEISDSEEDEDIQRSPEMPTMKRNYSNLVPVSIKMKESMRECCTSSVCSISESVSARTPDMPNENTEGMSTTAHSVIQEADPTRALAEETFRRQVLRQLSTINYKLDQLAEDVARLSMNERNNNLEIIEDSIFEKYDLPLKNSEELQKIEKYLETTENRRNMVCELSKLGGSNHKVMTKRLLEKLLMNSLAMNYSWLGFKKKENFSALNLSKVVIESVMKIHKKVTEADVELAIKGWLVKAKEREEKSLK